MRNTKNDREIPSMDTGVVPGTTGLQTSNDASRTNLQGKEGMSVPSNRRGGSNRGGSNDKGAGESDKGTMKRRKGVSRIEKS